jgi:hypothetical protein
MMKPISIRALPRGFFILGMYRVRGVEASESGVGEGGGGFAEELLGVDRFGEDTDAARQAKGGFVDGLVIGVEAGEDEDAAVGEFAVYLVDEEEAVLAGHGDVAEQEVGLELVGLIEGVIGGVSSSREETALPKDHRECVGYYMFVVYYQDTLHSTPLSFGGRQYSRRAAKQLNNL